MSKEKSYDFTDLVLLVGTNPLPNYVVAKYFYLTNNKDLQRIWLFYSEGSRFYEGTAQYADDIEGVLRKELIPGTPEIIKAPLSNISQANVILDQVKKHLIKRESDIKKIHLNYTGGTKAMAVHTYRELENEIKARLGGNFSASYLDARDFNIKIDQYPEKLTGDLRKLIQLKWEDLFALHNNEKIERYGKNYFENIDDQSEIIMQSIADLAEKNKLLDFRSWVNSANQNNSQRENAPDKEMSLFNKPKYNKSDEEVENIINARLSDFAPKHNTELFDCLSIFPEQDRFADKDGNWIYNNFGISGKADNSKSLTNFLTGKWLETYVTWVLNKKIAEHKIGRSKVISNYELRTKKGTGSHKYEVDVLVTNGYQLCGISCSASSNNDSLKNRGFEVILRSSQMGGDETQAVLVTLLETQNAFSLENDLKASLGASGSRFLVLGIDDLKIERMWDKLEKHIYG